MKFLHPCFSHSSLESCISDCSKSIPNPYCGSDGNDYKNPCEMYNAICKTGGKFNHGHRGPCGMNNKDLFAGKIHTLLHAIIFGGVVIFLPGNRLEQNRYSDRK